MENEIHSSKAHVAWKDSWLSAIWEHAAPLTQLQMTDRSTLALLKHRTRRAAKGSYFGKDTQVP